MTQPPDAIPDLMDCSTTASDDFEDSVESEEHCGKLEIWLERPGGVANHILLATGAPSRIVGVFISEVPDTVKMYYRKPNEPAYDVMEKNDSYASIVYTNAVPPTYPVPEFTHPRMYNEDVMLAFCKKRSDLHKRYNTGYELWIGRESDLDQRDAALCADGVTSYYNYRCNPEYSPYAPNIFLNMPEHCHCGACKVRALEELTGENLSAECKCDDCKILRLAGIRTEHNLQQLPGQDPFDQVLNALVRGVVASYREYVH